MYKIVEIQYKLMKIVLIKYYILHGKNVKIIEKITNHSNIALKIEI